MNGRTNKNRISIRSIAAVILACVALFSAIMLYRELAQSKKEAETFAELAAMRLPVENTTAAGSPAPRASSRTKQTKTAQGADGTPLHDLTKTENTDTDERSEDEGEPPRERTVLPRYLPLYERNQDYFAWLTIPGTNIDYPVMYSPDRPQFYLSHDFDNNPSAAGVPFLDASCDPEGTYYLIYGHRMRAGTMFAGLVEFEKKSFWDEHASFTLATLYEERKYMVAIAMRARVIKAGEQDGFRYYNYKSLDTESDFNEYMEQARAIALYDTGVDMSFGDEILVLSTCDYFTSGGRFVVIAKRIE